MQKLYRVRLSPHRPSHSLIVTPLDVLVDAWCKDIFEHKRWSCTASSRVEVKCAAGKYLLLQPSWSIFAFDAIFHFAIAISSPFPWKRFCAVFELLLACVYLFLWAYMTELARLVNASRVRSSSRLCICVTHLREHCQGIQTEILYRMIVIWWIEFKQSRFSNRKGS